MEGFGSFLTVIVIIALYMIPTIIAYMRGHASRHAIAAINVIAGWTIFAWFWVLIWALANKGASNTVVINGDVTRN